MNGGRFAGDHFDRNGRGYGRGYGYGRGNGYGYYPWGFWLGSNYWGFGWPWWYGGFPFWYDTLAGGAYWDPYYDGNIYDYGGYDYGEPIAQATSTEAPADDPNFSAARTAFYSGDYTEAQRDIVQAMVDEPNNQDIHEFHSLILFAMGDFGRHRDAWNDPSADRPL